MLKYPLKSYGTLSVYCSESELEDVKTELKKDHYCWSLYKETNPQTGEFRRYRFEIPAIANLTAGTVEAQ